MVRWRFDILAFFKGGNPFKTIDSAATPVTFKQMFGGFTDINGNRLPETDIPNDPEFKIKKGDDGPVIEFKDVHNNKRSFKMKEHFSADSVEAAENFLRAQRRGIDLDGAAGKRFGYCHENPAKCTLAAGVGLYLANKYREAYNKLLAEQRQCLALCYPDDWEKYKDNTITEPTYKENGGVIDITDTKNPKTDTYDWIYEEELDEDVCTPDNLEDEGFEITDKDHCDDFCEYRCDFDWDDVVDEGNESFVKDITKRFKDTMQSILDGIGAGLGIDWKIIGLVLAGIVVFMVILKMM